MSAAPRVLIVGAGPSGLVCALSLLHNGVPVRIIEKSIQPRTGQRGAGIMPRSLELFNSLGFADKVLELAIPPPRTRRYQLPKGIHPIDEFEMSPHTEPTPSCPFPNIVLLGQSHLEDILRAALAELSCEVEVGTELVSFSHHEHGVEVRLARHVADGSDVVGPPEHAVYDWIIGADGARGVVRKMAGFSFLGETRTIENHVVGDIYVDGLSQKYWHMWGDASSMLLSFRPTETPGLFNFVIAGPEIKHAQLATDERALRKFFEENAASENELKFKEITWVNQYTPNIRMVQTFQKGRVLLVGDAAHVHSFTGGQGMNTGIQDSFNLGWKLALVLRNLASPPLLETYSEERIPVIREMLSRTTKMLKRTFTEGTNDAFNRTGGLLQLGINYRWSSLILDERKQYEDDEFSDFDFGDVDDEPKAQPIDLDAYGGRIDGIIAAGDRAPDATGLVDLSRLSESRPSTRRHLFSIFGPSYHTVIIYAPAPAQCQTLFRMLKKCPPNTVRSVVIVPRGHSVPAACQGADAVFEDRDGHAYAGYGIVDDWGVVVVRPDGVVGAIVTMVSWRARVAYLASRSLSGQIIVTETRQTNMNDSNVPRTYTGPQAGPRLLEAPRSAIDLIHSLYFESLLLFSTLDVSTKRDVHLTVRYPGYL
ncbi:putative FAD binding domain containing protein [Lyophyllum shimeji]|uniref:FAD binding domain containing protein n=1 Tax=Lyophyllum shimeji TaxID=47721 RepID=A0A9P3PUH1_LYOSH|nr:putative FAD binding domain containing protein [Lyophyllum shimeji]